jgi:hypothetical protein
LKQDIARAARAISLLDLKPDKETGYPEFIPLNFLDYPLTGLLIIVDNLQEYLRWEGTSIRGGTKLLLFPEVAIDASDDRLSIEFAFFVSNEPDARKYIISQVQSLAKKKGTIPRESTLDEASQDLCNSLAEELARRLVPSTSFQVELSFWDSDRCLFSRNIHL